MAFAVGITQATIPTNSIRINPTAERGLSPWVESCALQTRKGASARRPPPSTWRSGWRFPEPGCCWSISIRSATPPAAWAASRPRAIPLVSQAPLRESLVESNTAGLELLPGSRNFQDVESLAGPTSQVATLRQHLASGLSNYDFVLIDCPPSLGQLTRTALAGSTEVLMPIQCEYFAMEGLAQMIEVIRQVMKANPRRLQFGGILLTMVDESLELTHEVERQVREFFGEIVFRNVVPRDVAVSEAPSHGQSVLEYAPRAVVPALTWNYAAKSSKRRESNDRTAEYAECKMNSTAILHSALCIMTFYHGVDP